MGDIVIVGFGLDTASWVAVRSRAELHRHLWEDNHMGYRHLAVVIAEGFLMVAEAAVDTSKRFGYRSFRDPLF